jgi:hypothetical protein
MDIVADLLVFITTGKKGFVNLKNHIKNVLSEDNMKNVLTILQVHFAIVVKLFNVVTCHTT